jgi:hypothetical protein
MPIATLAITTHPRRWAWALALLGCGSPGAMPDSADTGTPTDGSGEGDDGVGDDGTSGGPTPGSDDADDDGPPDPGPDLGGPPDPPPGARGGLVRLEGSAFVDDGGPFLARSATMMWAAWAYRHDRPRLEANLEFLSAQGFHAIRALGVVGDPAARDYWDGREIDAHWPDYAEVIAGLTDLAWDEYGLRIEWTLIGDGQITVPSLEEREALVDTFLAMSEGREEKILHFEIANESWQNGFDGADGTAQLRALTSSMRDRTEILVAASAPPSSLDCAGIAEFYEPPIADIATIHFDRDIGQVDGSWRPVWQPWTYASCGLSTVATNNEPIGPGASVATDDDPERLAAAAAATWISGLPHYVFHSHAGVRGDEDFFGVPGIDALAHFDADLPLDLAAWSRREPSDPAGPLVVFAEAFGEAIPDATWPETPGAESGVVAALGAESGDEFAVLLLGVLDHVVVEARGPVSLQVRRALDGRGLEEHRLAAGERVTLGGAGALVLRGTRG